MKQLIHDLRLGICKLWNLCLMAFCFALCWYGHYATHLYKAFYRRGNWYIILLFLVIYWMFTRVYDALRVSLYRISDMIVSQCLSFLLADGILYILICILARELAAFLPGLLCVLGQVVVACVWSVAAHKWYYHCFPPKNTVVVFDKREGMENLIATYGLSKKFKVTCTVHAREVVDNLALLDGFETIFISGVPSHERNCILKYCVSRDREVYVIPRIGDIIVSGGEMLHLFYLPILRTGKFRRGVLYAVMKRLWDILFSLTAALLTLPLQLGIALAIHLEDGGPVLYRQTRLTKGGREFQMLKFRSMRLDAEKDGVARLSTGDQDPRVTKVGRILRRFRLDELPQFYNILRGDMSVVGPRPERPEIAAEYEKTLPEFRLRLQTKAGLTGYAQVYGKYNSTPYDKLMMDMVYISRLSLKEDLAILLATVRLLFVPESTEGVGEGKRTAE